MLAGTDHRLKPLRKMRAAALPGKSLALFECATGLVTQTVLWEDAHSQERALLPDFTIPAGVHLIADRNFCVRWFLEAIEAVGSFFTIRHHKQFDLSLQGKRRKIGRCETGMAYEQAFDHGEDQSVGWRVVSIQLDTPTRDGETEIVLITNLPAKVTALAIAAGYRTRWTIENHFQRLTDYLNCEVPTLGEPRAALFAFATSLIAGNILAVVIAALAAAQGKELTDNLSYHYLVDDVAGNYRGMMVALPPKQWEFIRAYTPKELAKLLHDIARNADPVLLRKTVRGPKKPRKTPNCTNIRHVSTRRILDGC
jgi:Transposase DDE domain